MATHTNRHTDFSRHTDQLREKAAELGSDAQDLGKITKKLAGDAVDFINENAANYYKQGMQSAKKVEKTLESKIKEKPVQALLIAAGVGLVLGAFWRRRK